jgi:hypothetical protein
MSEPYDEKYGEDYDGPGPGEDVLECDECDGYGWITGDCFEDTCCCLDPDADHDAMPCPKCNPNGTL